MQSRYLPLKRYPYVSCFSDIGNMTESQRQSWLAYLSRGYLGKETENAIAPVPLPIPKGPGLHRICEPIDASVECEAFL